MSHLMGITQSSFDPASRFRFVQFIPHLERSGWRVDFRPNRPDRQWHSTLPSRSLRALHYRAGRLVMKANRLRDVLAAPACDVVFVNRDLASEGAGLRRLFQRAIHKTVFDFDDAIFVGSRESAVRWMCTHAGWVTPGNEYLAQYARQFNNNVTIIPTVIDTDACRPGSAPAGRTGLVRIGWSGSDQSIQATLVPQLAMLRELQAKMPFELVVITNTAPRLPVPDLRWRFVPWSARGEAHLADELDIGIMPLADDAFQRGKCALKLLQYMAAGLPTVASPVGVNATVVQPGVTGFLATSPAQWHAALARLLGDTGLRARLGAAGRQVCEQDYSIRRWLPTLLQIFDRIREATA